jgi:hypothetical protein
METDPFSVLIAAHTSNHTLFFENLGFASFYIIRRSDYKAPGVPGNTVCQVRSMG